MLVREVWKNAKTGETGERWIEMDVRTPEEQAAIDQQEAAQAAAEAGNELTLRERADLALTANAAFLAKPNRTQADFTAQVDALTRQQNGLIRLVLRKLDSVQGTAGAGGKAP